MRVQAARSEPGRAARARAEQDHGRDLAGGRRSAAPARQPARSWPGGPRRWRSPGRPAASWLIDEDGDPVMPAWPAARPAGAFDGRALAAGRARRQAAGDHRGRPRRQPIQAQLAWLRPAPARGRSSARRARSAAGTGSISAAPASARPRPAEAVASFGNHRTRAYDPAVLQLLGLQELERLLPAVIDATRHQGTLARTAAAASGLRSARRSCWRRRTWWRARSRPASPTRAMIWPARSSMPPAANCASCRDRHETTGRGRRRTRCCRSRRRKPRLAVSPSPGGADLDWLVGLGVQLLADTGLIGIAARRAAGGIRAQGRPGAAGDAAGPAVPGRRRPARERRGARARARARPRDHDL